MALPVPRFCVDWDDDLFVCAESLTTDTLNRMHTSLSTDAGYVNLHWNAINTSAINSSTISFSQGATAYGIRQFNCVTGTNTTAGAYFGRTGSTNDFSVSNAHTYTYVFWIKATVGSGTSITVTMENSTGSTSTFTISTSWQKISHTFATTSTTTAFKIVKNSSATNVTWQATGFMIVDSSTAPNGFNVGHATNIYDNITQDVKSAAYSLGKRNWLSTKIDEGVADLTLDNSTRRYSPEYTGGPLYTYMKQRLLITIDIQDPVLLTYTRKWSGFIRSYAPQPGQTRGKEMRMRCEQGKFQLDTIEYTAPLSGTYTADQIIQKVILAGYISAATPLQALANRAKTRASYTVSLTDILSLDTGLSSLNVTGETWGVGVAASRILEDMMKVEQGFLFIDRSGKVRFYNRLHYIDPDLTPATTAVNLNTDAVKFEYTYGADFYNNVKATFYPSDVSSAETLWQSNGGMRVKARSRRRFFAHLEHTEGGKRNAAAVNAFDAASDPSLVSILNGDSALGKVTGSILGNQGGQVWVEVHNATRQAVRATVTLRGTSVQSFGGQVWEATDSTNGIRGGKITYDINSKLLADEDSARHLANYLLNALKTPTGQFTSYTLMNKSNTMLQTILNNGIGSKVSVSEYQTGHSGTYFICGESHQWKPGTLESTFYLFPLGRINYAWRLGTSVMGTQTYLAY